MAGKVKTWVWIVVGLAVLIVLGLVAMAGAGLYFFSRHLQSTETSPVVAARSFEEVRARFPEQVPLIELDEHGEFLRTNRDRGRPANTPPLQAVHVMAFNPDEGRLVRATIPFWALRLMSRGEPNIDVHGRQMSLEELRITAEDLQRFGPTLILDHRSPRGERVVVWSE